MAAKENQSLVCVTRKRIEKRDYEALFAHGGCLHFALRLHENFKLKLRGIREGHGGKSLSHVWCLRKEGQGIDIRGIYPECLLVKLANGGKEAEMHDIAADELRAAIHAKELPPDLEARIFEIADWVVANHERFEGVKPTNECQCEEWLKNIRHRR